jgi:hypothetical protein
VIVPCARQIDEAAIALLSSALHELGVRKPVCRSNKPVSLLQYNKNVMCKEIQQSVKILLACICAIQLYCVDAFWRPGAT